MTAPNSASDQRNKHRSPVSFWLAAWIIFCVFCNCTGWALSTLHALNRAGYAAAFTIGMIALLIWWMKSGRPHSEMLSWRKLRKRYCKPFPLAFLSLSSLAILGGILYPPTNYDALAYRTPRVLHWLAEGQWHWIHTDFQRLNTRGAAMEWVTAPLFLFTGSDRLEFLINGICFLLLPGLTFGILKELGVRSRTAWFWMWLFPTGYGFLLQAGSISNDLFGATFSMAAIFFALTAKRRSNAGKLCLSFLSAGLMTSGKAFNLLLLLPWIIVVLPSLRLLLSRPVLSVLCAVATLFASLIPTAVLNYRACGDWTGLRLEQPLIGGASPAFRFSVNTVLLSLNHLAPPIFPFTGQWNHFVHAVVPQNLADKLESNFESSAAHFEIGEMQMEETAGLGLGLTFLLAWTLVRKLKEREVAVASFRTAFSQQWFWISASAWFGVAIFMSKSGLYCPARYLAPFYVFIIVPLLRGKAASTLTRRSSWRIAGLCTFLLASVLVIASPPRPLWPAQSVLQSLGAQTSTSHLLQRAWRVYSVYGARADAFAPIRKALPPDSTPLGLVTFDDPETSLWRPFGSRRILHVPFRDTIETTQKRGIHYVLVSSYALSHTFGTSASDWLARNPAEVIQRFELDLRAQRGPTEWLLVKINSH